MTESIESPAPRAARSWRPLIIAAVAVLAVGIGAVAGSFLLSARAAGAGAAAGYVPADAALYFEWRVAPSDDQDAALREILGRFPIPEFDPETPIIDQLSDLVDDELAASGVDISYAGDIEPWWDGSVAFGMTEIPTTDESMAGEISGLLVLAGVTDRQAAEAAMERIRDAGGDVDFEGTEHDGTTIWAPARQDAHQSGAYAVTDDQLVFAMTADDVAAALDRHAAGGESIAESEAMQRLGADLPDDWLMLGIVNGEQMVSALQDEMESANPEAASMYDALLEGQSLNAVMSVVATPDRLLFENVTDAPTGDFAMANEDRGLAARVPDDALFYAEGGNVGGTLTRLVDAFSAAVPVDEGMDGLDPGALLGDPDELIGWIDDGAVVAGWDGEEPYGGLLLVPSDADAARESVNGLLGLARLGTLDPSLGVTITEETVGDADVTTIRWEGDVPIPELGLPAPGSAPFGVALQVALSDDLVIIGLGDRFATRTLELDGGDSLASAERFASAVGDLGGADNAGMTWLDVTRTREAVESALGDAGMLDGFVDYEADVRPWLTPFDRVVGVIRIEGDRMVQRAAVIFD